MILGADSSKIKSSVAKENNCFIYLFQFVPIFFAKPAIHLHEHCTLAFPHYRCVWNWSIAFISVMWSEVVAELGCSCFKLFTMYINYNLDFALDSKSQIKCLHLHHHFITDPLLKTSDVFSKLFPSTVYVCWFHPQSPQQIYDISS